MSSFAIPDVFQNTCPGHAGGPPGFLIAQLVQTLLAAQCAVSNANAYPRDCGDEIKDEEEFDFIVVGAGSSGSVIASRLSENPNWKILLLEAGGDPTFISDIPGFLFSTQGTDIDWQYFSEKATNGCLGINEHKCPYPRGKALGGSSTINAMLYVRGNPEDYNEWEAAGNEGWNYDSVLEFFKRSENLNGYVLADDVTYKKNVQVDAFKGHVMSQKYHSTTGPLSVSPFADGALSDVKNAILSGVQELGFPVLEDFNGEKQIGFSNAPGTLFQGTRANTAKMFLGDAKNRSNLFVVKNAVVTKMIMKNNNVRGVAFVRNNRTRVVFAKKEVVLSAGAINSPQILMLSGIGPQEHLKSAGLSSVVDLPGVGENFQDHFVFLGTPFSVLKSHSQPLPPLVALDAIYMYLTNRPGLYSSIGLTDLMGFVDTQNNSSVPDIQYIFVKFLKQDAYLLPEILRVLHFTDDLKAQYLEMVKDSGVLLIAPVVLRPKSRGRIRLDVGDPNGAPKIFSGILDDPEDKETLLRGIKLALKLRETQSFQALGPELIRFKFPECDKHKFESDEYWLCLMKYITASLYHPVGTCKMGPRSDPLAVVDNKLKVHGVGNLRIADASIMPTIVRGNTNAPSIMIGEKAADLIRREWENRDHNEL